MVLLKEALWVISSSRFRNELTETNQVWVWKTGEAEGSAIGPLFFITNQRDQVSLDRLCC